jgi:hypothetical protein
MSWSACKFEGWAQIKQSLGLSWTYETFNYMIMYGLDMLWASNHKTALAFHDCNTKGSCGKSVLASCVLTWKNQIKRSRPSAHKEARPRLEEQFVTNNDSISSLTTTEVIAVQEQVSPALLRLTPLSALAL